MAEILFLQYPKCSTCRKAAKWLKDNNVNGIKSRDIAIDNPTKKELGKWIPESGLPIAKFFNTSGLKYRELNIKDKVKTSSTDELLDILASDGMLVKRPILVGENFVLVGFDEEQWKSKLL